MRPCSSGPATELRRLMPATPGPRKRRPRLLPTETVRTVTTAGDPRTKICTPSGGRSRFALLFAGDAGIDPYTRAVSDVYQDLFREGSFIGKGIYDVDALQRAIGGRFPENRVLSHDLLEGAYGRAGLVSDV